MAIHAGFTGRLAGNAREQLLSFAFLAMFSELFSAILVLLVLAFIWALFQPAWIVRGLYRARDHVWHSLWFFVLGFLVSLAVCYAIA